MSVSERGNTNNTSLHTNLRVAFPRVSPSTDYDPSEIKIDSDYIFLENIFSPLVEFDEYGDLTSGIAEQFFVEPGKIKFVIRQGIETIDGYEITSEDVEFSLTEPSPHLSKKYSTKLWESTESRPHIVSAA